MQVLVPGRQADARPLHASAARFARVSTYALRTDSQVQSARFLSNKPHDPGYAYELFRRAICEADAAAWTAIVADLRPLVVAAIRRQAGHQMLTDEDDWVNRTFERFWRAIRPERMSLFPDTPSLLRYLKVCATSVYLDHLRDQRRHITVTLDDAEPAALVGPDLERELLDDQSARELWASVIGLLKDDQERSLAYLTLVRGMTPREVRAHAPGHFASIDQVYQTKRRVLERLRSARELQAFLSSD